MFVGEAPGAEEDRTGLPFVGRAGKFLGELLEGVGLSRDEVFINNVLLCRPPGNRDPQPEEIEVCRPWLETKIDLIQPRVIATLGNFATKLLTANPTGITKVRGTPQEHVLGGRPVYVFPLFHPAAGLRIDRDRRPAPRGLQGDPAAAGAAAARSRRRASPAERPRPTSSPRPPRPPTTRSTSSAD